MDRPRFVIEASEAESMAKQSGVSSVLSFLPSLVSYAQSLARVPISTFPVGAVGLADDGRIFFGVNLEFPGLPLHHSVHAEQFLATSLALHRSRDLRYIAVSSAPCGHCRQFLQEIRGSTDIGILITGAASDDADFKPLSHLLPHRFGPDDLLDQGFPLLLEIHSNGLALLGRQTHGCDSGNGGGKLASAALEAANGSHAPYSGCPSGVALLDCRGEVYSGTYMESAAYNPSLGPVQAALVAYVVGGGGGYDDIVAAVLVEKQGAKVAQEHTARLILQEISPRCELRVFHCSPSSNESSSSYASEFTDAAMLSTA